MAASHSASSHRQLVSRSNTNPMNNGYDSNPPNQFARDISNMSTKDINFQKVLQTDPNVGEQTVYQVEVENEGLLRKSNRSELASKNQLLTRRWQTALAVTLVVLPLIGGIGGLAYWITIPKVITQPYLLYGESCYPNSRSCDDTRQLWCPNGTCLCTGNYQWNSTAQNCSCGLHQTWTGLQCQGYGSYGDPCNSIACLPTLSCSTVINQTYSTGQAICDCDNTTYLDTDSFSSTYRTCIPKISYGVTCLTNFDCKSWLGLTCTSVNSGISCQCGSTSYWNGSICVNQAWGGDPCSITVPCDTARGLTCSSSSNTCVCDALSYWDNVTTFWCQTKKTYAITCQYTFQCNTTVNLTCPTTSTGCNCPTTSSAHICDCASGNFWDGQECVAQHIFNGTCPGQYACSSNLVCYLGHCICPGNMVWNTPTPNTCACTNGTVWNSISNTCL